jgi:hypothetical protein
LRPGPEFTTSVIVVNFTHSPDPLFMQNIQEFRIRQGLAVSESGLNTGFVLEKQVKGVRGEAGFGNGLYREKRWSGSTIGKK